MAESNHIDSDMISTPSPPPGMNFLDEDSMRGNDEEEALVEGDLDGQENVESDGHPDDEEGMSTQVHQGMVEEALHSVDHHEGYQEHGDITVDDAQYEQHNSADTYLYEAHEPHNSAVSAMFDDHTSFQEPLPDDQHQHSNVTFSSMQGSSSFHPIHVDNENHDATSSNHYEDASTLFVSERESLSPQPTLQPRSFINIVSRTQPSAPIRTDAPKSIFSKIRGMQKRLQERRNAVNRRVTLSLNTNPDNEAFLEAVTPGIPTPMGIPPVDEDELADKEAVGEFQKKKKYYLDLKKKNGGKLSFRQDIEWRKIEGAEDARRKKRLRDIAKAQEEEGIDSSLFPEVHLATVDDAEAESDHAIDAENTSSRKRRRQKVPLKQAKGFSMQDAELQSMRVALEAQDDLPKKRRKGQSKNDYSLSTGTSGRGKGPHVKYPKGPKAKPSTKKATKSSGGRRTAKERREADFAVRQATSLFNSDVFQQQAGADAIEQPTATSRKKEDALKELIASVPTEDYKKAKSDINNLLVATKDFDGRGSVKADGSGLWLVKGMKTSLKNYQVLGTAFMRRRENASDEPKGGLMADQMGLGKTLMMLGE